MADTFKFFQLQPFTLSAAGTSIGATSLILTSMLDINGVAVAMTDFGTVGFGTLEPSSGTNEEQISFTGITQNGNGTATLTGVKTVLFKAPYTQTSGLAKSHAGGVEFIISNTAGFYNEFLGKGNDESISGLYTYTQLPQSVAVPAANADLTNKLYVDNLVLSGAPNATTAVKGIIQLPTQAQVDAKTAVGSTGASMAPTPALLRSTLYNDYVADTGSASTYAIAPSPTYAAYAAGQQFTFKAATANSANAGVSTLAVNGLAQKTIKNSQGNDLVVNDIIVGQIVTVVYDGTNFQMLNVSGRGYVGLSGTETVAGIKSFSSSPTAPTPGSASDVAIKSYVDGNPITATNGVTTKTISDASGSQTIAHGLGRTPKRIRITATVGTGNNSAMTFLSFGVYNGSTTANVSQFINQNGTTQAMATTNGSTNILSFVDLSGNSMVATATVDGTNITLSWTKAGSPTGTANLMWEAE